MAHRKTERNPLFAGRWFEGDIINPALVFSLQTELPRPGRDFGRDLLSEFMRTLGIYDSGDHPQTRLKRQMGCLFNASVRLVYDHEHGATSIHISCSDVTVAVSPSRTDQSRPVGPP